MITKTELIAFCREFSYPNEAQEALLAGLKAIEETPTLHDAMEQWLAVYDHDGVSTDFDKAIEEIPQHKGTCAAHTFTILLLFYIACTRHLHELYRERGLSDTLYCAAVTDLRYKAEECRRVFGCWGTFVAFWFPRFFQVSRFSLGCLQYETFEMPETYTVNGVLLQKGQTVINVHIPGGGPLLPKEVTDSFRQAAAFYAPLFDGEIVPFVCHSWLLFPPNRQILPPQSRILQFMDQFEIVAEDRDAANHDAWRIFNTMKSDDPDALPHNTSVQRAYAEWLKAGNCMGEGFGVHFEPRVG